MQANSQQSGQLQNLHGKGTTAGDGTSNTLDQNFYQQCLPSHAASPSYSGQGATGNYLTQFACTIQPTASKQILTSNIQATKDSMLAQENITSKYTLQTGKQDSKMILWNVPSNSQIFLPVNNMNVQGATNNNGPNMSHCAFNSNNIFYMQQQNSSLGAGANHSQQVTAKPMDTKSFNEAKRSVNTINLHSRQQHANSPTNLPKKLQRTSLPSDLNYHPPTKNASHGHSSFFGGYNYQSFIPGKTTHATVQTPSTCVQNSAAQRAVAVVMPLSPIGTASVNVSDKSANMKMNERSAQEIVWHQPNIPHALEANTNLNKQKGEINDPSMHQRPKSAEPRLNDGLCHVGTKSPVCTESTGQICRTSLPKNVVAEEKKSVPTQIQNEPSEKINNCTNTDKETETIPVIEWPLERLHTLIAMFEQMDNVHLKNVQKCDAGRDILKLYWNGDFRKFHDAVQTGIYQKIMEEIYVYSPMKEPVVLRQIKSDARNKVIKDFHVLKHNEESPKMTYKSSWLNLNENVDDIDKECGYSWFYKSFQNTPDHEAPCKTQNHLQEATKKPSSKWLPTEVENKVPAEEPTLENESLQENLPVVFNGQSPPLIDVNCSPKHDCVFTGQQKDVLSQIEIGSHEKMPNNDCAILDKNARCETFPKPNQELTLCMNEVDVSASKMNVLPHEMMEHNVIAASSDKHETSLLNTSKVLDKISPEEKSSKERLEVLKKSASRILSTLSTLYKPSLAEHNNGSKEMTNKVQVEEQTSLEKNVYNAHSPAVTNSRSLNLNVVEEQTSCQPNAINPLNAKTSLVRTLKERDYLLRKHQNFEMAATQALIHRASLLQTRQENYLLTKGQMERLEGADGNCLLKGYLVEEQTKCQSNTMNPLKAMTHLVRGVGEKRTNKRTSRLDKRSYKAAKRPSLTGSASQIDCASPLKLHPVIAEPSQMQFNEMPEIDSVLTESERCETDPNPSEELPVQMNEEEIVEMDTSIRINVLPQEVAKQCFAGQLMDDQDIAAQLERVHETSSLYTPQVTISTKEQIDMWKLEIANGSRSSNGNLVAEQTDQLKAMTPLVRPVGEQHPTEKCEKPENANSKLDDSFCNEAKCLLTTGSTCQLDCISPPKLHPVIAEPSQKLNEVNEEMPDIDYMLTDDSMRCETDPKPSQELALNINEEETDKTDALDSIKINVLPHNMAELWFSGEMEAKDLQEDIDVHITTEDQVKVQVLELMSEKDLHLDVKPKEGKSQGSGDETLETFCCLAKWFQTLDSGNSSLCMCQKKAEFSEGTSLELQTEKEDSNELVELENPAPEGTEDSEVTENSETEDETHLLNDYTGDKTKILKDISSSEEVHKMETEISEQTRDDSPSECATNVTMNNEVEQDMPTPDLKMKTDTICLALFGSSSGRNKLKLTTRSNWKESCEEPPETLQVTIHSHQKIKGKSMSKKRKAVESQDEDVVDNGERTQRAPFKDLALHETLPSHPISELSKNALSSTSIKKLLSTSANAKSGVHLGEGNKQRRQRKRQHKYSTQQMSMNKYVIRGKMPSKLLHSPGKVTKSKYELGNPALMPLEDGISLEFKVLPESFNFEDGAELNCAQADMSPITPNGMSGPEDKQRETTPSPTQGIWSFSPLKKKHAQPTQVTDVSGTCSLFQEFKKKYHKKKEIASKQNSSDKV